MPLYSGCGNFVAHLFQEGYQYRSPTAHWSVIPLLYEKMDGETVG